MHADLDRWVRIPDSLRVSSWTRPQTELSSAVASSTASRARRRRFRSGGLAACEQQQIGGHDRRPSIRIERTQGSPGLWRRLTGDPTVAGSRSTTGAGEPGSGGGILIQRASTGPIVGEPVARNRRPTAQPARRESAQPRECWTQVFGAREAARDLATCWRQLGPVMSMRMACIARRSRIAAVSVASPR